ncbi:MAG: hypothetical protein DCF25_10700 [Leptolyngbya foveolarum]|uniref:[cytidine(C)-cytidine(C)-adenosine (A)]-adding enzyme n=1 Tax=Leptolyngbya foveolarum TaxID=47253 RepID=A0A2W4UB39_9CYAN|nr:MAG: hypothetical protein DCF25_10700 [Leptolyngbya foveolarum]
MALFSPETWPFSLNLLPDDTYLVGGSVRDRLLKRSAAYLDLDFVLSSNAVKTAATIANTYNAGFVVLDEARQIARVVFAEMTVDFAQQQGETIAVDLQRRDFTINAIAYHPTTHQLIDPLGGEADIAHKILRMVSYENLAADPLRLMRGYRQAAQLKFTLSTETQLAIRQLAPLLAEVSSERVHSELDALLSIPAGSDYLASMLENRLLQFCLPHFDSDRVKQIKAVDGAIAQFQSQMPDYAERLKSWLKPAPAGHYRSWIKAVKLSRMVGAKPKQAEAELVDLKYSRSEIQTVTTLLEAQPDIDAMIQGQFTQAQQFFLFKAAGDCFPAVSLLALSQGVPLSLIQPMIERFLNPDDAIAHVQTLITGRTLMKQLKLKPGPQIGQILKAVEQAQADGRVKDEESAIAFVFSIFDDS